MLMKTSSISAKPLFSPMTPQRADLMNVLGAAVLAPIAAIGGFFLIDTATSIGGGNAGLYEGLYEGMAGGMAAAVIFAGIVLYKRFRWRGIIMALTAPALLWAIFYGSPLIPYLGENQLDGWVLVLAVIPIYFLTYYQLRRGSILKALSVLGAAVILAIASFWLN